MNIAHPASRHSVEPLARRPRPRHAAESASCQTSARLQPVFRGSGQIYEYAFIPDRGESFYTENANWELWMAVILLRRHKADLQLSIPWRDEYAHPSGLIDGLKRQVEVIARRCQDRLHSSTKHGQSSQTAVLSEGLTFAVPMCTGLVPCPSLLDGYREFQIHLRVSISSFYDFALPPGSRGPQVTGLRVVLPPNAADVPSIQNQFFTVVALARERRLDVVVADVDDMADTAWLRQYRDVSLQGAALSRPLSCDLLRNWWIGEADWRSFSVRGSVR